MKKVLNNNKGYMLIEIILASVLAFGIAFFILNLTFKLKNKNDDMMIKTEVSVDQTIITNKLMQFATVEANNFDCNDDGLKINYQDNSIIYKGKLIDKLSEYAVIGEKKCEVNDDYVHISIPISVPQQPEKNYDVDIFYRINKIEKICYDDLNSNQTSFFKYTGDYELIDDCQDNGTGVCTISGSLPCDWKIKFLTSGTLTFYYLTWNIDVFLVGGGYNGNNGTSSYCSGYGYNCTGTGGSGGAGGKSKTILSEEIANGVYPIVVGVTATASTAFEYSTNNGVSGGGGGAAGYPIGYGYGGGSATSGGMGGQGVYEFNGTSGSMYAGGGGGGGGNADYNNCYGCSGNWQGQGTATASGGSGGLSGGGSGGSGLNQGNNGVANTGGGGGGAAGRKSNDASHGRGGSGVVIIRNTRADR